MNYGASSDDWINFDLLGLSKDLLPVVSNPDAPISPKSTLQQRGKIPSRYNKLRQISGIPNWTQHVTTEKEMEEWSKEPDYGICIQTRFVRALDIDVQDQTISSEIVEFISGHFHGLGFPCRSRNNSGKCLLAFSIKGEMPKRTMKVKGGIIEFLANGQQFVAQGQHPSGARYEWDWAGHNNFPELALEEFEGLWQTLTTTYAIETPNEASLRNPPSQDSILASLKDEVSQYLNTEGYVTGLGKEGQVFIRCPFEAEHTETTINAGTSTAYLPAGGRDYALGHFSCLHAHCTGRQDEEFLDAVNYRSKDFEVLPDEPEDPKKAERFDIIPAGVFSRKPVVKWLIKDILPERGFYQFYGGSGDGKTFATLDMMLSLCRGIDWNGHKIKRKHKIVYICAEGAGGFISRLKAYADYYKINLDEIELGIIPETPDFRKLTDIKTLADKINIYGQVDITIVDTLAQVTAGADENTSKDMGPALKNCAELMRLTNAGCGLVHHSGKDISKGARGWSGLKAPLDAEFCVTKDENGARKFWVDKLKDARDGFGFDFELETVNFGVDEDGDILTSCVVQYKGPAVKTKKEKLPKRGKNETIVYDTFMSLGGGEIAFMVLIEECLKYMPQIAVGKRDKRPSRISDALERLAVNGELRYERGMVSAPL